MALPLTVQAQVGIYGHNPPHSRTIYTYYFDGTVSDLDAAWVLDANVANGGTGTQASTSIPGSVTLNLLKVAGTSAPTTGSTIASVKVRQHAISTIAATVTTGIYDSGTLLGTKTSSAFDVDNWGGYTTLTVPSGGWTWTKIANLESRTYANHTGSDDCTISKIEVVVEVSDADYYFVTGNETTAIEVEKTADPSTTASVIQDTANAPVASPDHTLTSISDDRYIHILSVDSATNGAGLVEYHRFDMSTDTWDIIDHQVADIGGMAPSIAPYGSIALRETGGQEVIILSNGVPDAVMGRDYDRLDFWYGATAGTSFTGPTALDGSVSTRDERHSSLVLGDGNSIHAFWDALNNGSADLTKARTISPANALSTIRDGSTSVQKPLSAVSYDQSGTQKTFAVDNFTVTSSVVGLRADDDASNNIGTLTVETITTTDPSSLGPSTLVANGTDIYCLFSGGGTAGVDKDLYLITSADGGNTWSGEIELLNGVTINFISAAVLDNNTISYLYDDGGSLKYNEYSLGGDVDVPTLLETLVLTEQDATVFHQVDVEVSTDTESLVLTEQLASVDLAIDVDVETVLEELALTPVIASITSDVAVESLLETLTLTEQDATIEAQVDIEVSTLLETLVLTEQLAGVTAQINTDVPTLLEELNLTTAVTSITSDIGVETLLEEMDLTTYVGNITSDIGVTSDTESLALTTYDAEPTLGVNVTSLLEELNLTTVLADVASDVSVTSDTEALNLTTYDAIPRLAVNVLSDTETLSLSTELADVSQIFAYNIDAIAASLTLTEADATFGRDVEVFSDTEALAMTTYAANLGGDREVATLLEELNLTSYNSVITSDIGVETDTESLTLTELQGAVSRNIEVFGSLYELNLSPELASVSTISDVDVDTLLTEMTLTTYPAALAADENVAAIAASLSLTPNDAEVIRDIGVLAETETLSLSPQIAAIVFNTNVGTELETLSLVEEVAVITLPDQGTEVVADTQSLTITSQVAQIGLNKEIVTNTESLSLTEATAVVSLDIAIGTDTENLILGTQLATVSYATNVISDTVNLALAPLQSSIRYNSGRVAGKINGVSIPQVAP